MKTVELLASKRIVSVRPVNVGCSISAQGGQSKSWRFRVAVLNDTFSWLYEPMNGAPAPRMLVEGDGRFGLVVSLTRNSGNAMTAGKSLIAAAFSARDLGLALNRTDYDTVVFIAVEFEDGTRYLVGPPLPDPFLSTEERQRRARKPLEFTGVYVKTYEELYGEHPSAKSTKQTSTTTKEVETLRIEATVDQLPPAPEPTPEPTAAPDTAPVDLPVVEATTPDRLAALSRAPIQVGDLKELLAMFNDQVKQIRESGANVDLRVDENGQVRGRLQVIYQEDL